MHGLCFVHSVPVNGTSSVSLRYLRRSGQTDLPAHNQLPSVSVFGQVPHSLVYIEHYRPLNRVNIRIAGDALSHTGASGSFSIRTVAD
jgi:hypothetical protein